MLTSFSDYNASYLKLHITFLFFLHISMYIIASCAIAILRIYKPLLAPGVSEDGEAAAGGGHG